jgi:hypothetical protein
LIQLAASDDEEVAAISCYDIGEFIRFYPNGKVVAKTLGAREVVLKLIDSTNAEVQRHALSCLSKMLVRNWQVSHTALNSIVLVKYLTIHNFKEYLGTVVCNP